MQYKRFYLGNIKLEHVQNGNIVPIICQDFTNLDEYSRFKFGDGVLSDKYGKLLGEVLFKKDKKLLYTDEIYIAASAYRIAPSASYSLIHPFMISAKLVAKKANSDITLKTFKISKVKMIPNNYSAMTYKERKKILINDIVLPKKLNLRGKKVIILDDIRVTGLHETVLLDILEKAGVEYTSFYYILNMIGGIKYPQIEALININAIKTIEDIIKLANRDNFIPNVRVSKFIASRNIAAREKFYLKTPQKIFNKIMRYIQDDDLERIIKIIP